MKVLTIPSSSRKVHLAPFPVEPFALGEEIVAAAVKLSIETCSPIPPLGRSVDRSIVDR